MERVRQALLDLLNSTKIPQDRCGDQAVNHPKYGTHTAHLISFGISQSRKSRKERAGHGVYTRETVNYNNEKYATIYNALCRYMSLFAPGFFGETSVYHACIISKNSIWQWHRDDRNIGHASLTALWDFEGGEFFIEK